MFVASSSHLFVGFLDAVEVPPAGHRPRRPAPWEPVARGIAARGIAALAGVQCVAAEPVAAAIAGPLEDPMEAATGAYLVAN